MAMVAYNLTTQLRREAAKIANCAHEKSALPEFGQSTATCSKASKSATQ